MTGIGPEVVAKLLAAPDVTRDADLVVMATEEELAAAAATARVSLPEVETTPPAPVGAYELGTVSQAAGRRALEDLRRALDLHAAGEIDGILFAPLNKSALTLAGMTEHDELRWFANRLGHDGPTSELNVLPDLTTARVTSHVAIREVADAITVGGVVDACRLLEDALRGQGVAEPRLAVCALNPHGGENGKFGTEEIDTIRPGVEKARADGMDVVGPFPADTLFIRAFAGELDGVVTMYHDQGQIALKLKGFDDGVTVQGGLPVPIATPAHGTAHAIVGQGVATVRPTVRALEVVIGLARHARPA
ncbi:4-hydroxythreonine-4-phosphate dehydrogenase PdxA [Georgenia alba]|uniref:4-hydroxythreonine-4-phosphate dehydrogenase PdxA n=1 Tax=Georgenia alba TaxID=2233858 RepID=A0ABW2Q3Z3_9MICO